MIALTSQTAAAIAIQAAEGSWVAFFQVVPPGVIGPIMISGVRGKSFARQLENLVEYSPYETQLIGLLESQVPDEDAATIAEQFVAHQIKGWWFEPVPELIDFIRNDTQSTLSIMLAELYPGALSDAPVDIDGIAKILQVSVPTIRRMIKGGTIPYLKIGHAYRFVPNDVLASLRRLA